MPKTKTQLLGHWHELWDHPSTRGFKFACVLRRPTNSFFFLQKSSSVTSETAREGRAPPGRKYVENRKQNRCWNPLGLARVKTDGHKRSVTLDVIYLLDPAMLLQRVIGELLVTKLSKRNRLFLKDIVQLFTFPKCDFNWDSRFVVWAVRNPNQKVSRSYELYRRRYSTSKVAILVLRNSCYPIWRRFFSLRSITSTCGRG